MPLFRPAGAYQQEGEAGLVNNKSCARSRPKTTVPAIVDQILHLRRTYHLGLHCRVRSNNLGPEAPNVRLVPVSNRRTEQVRR
jgi:hypothetical protein